MTNPQRFHTGSKKWDELTANGVKEEEDIIPFSVADMEFATAPEIIDALTYELNHSIMAMPTPQKNI